MSIEIDLYRNAGLGNRLDGAYPLGDGTSGGSSTFPYDDTRAIASSPKYVAATGGSDGNDGSIGSPWATVNHALQQLLAGDTLYLRSGTHLVSSLNLNGLASDGTAINRVEVTSYPGEEPVIDMQSGDWLNLDTVDYWDFSHLSFINGGQAFQLKASGVGGTNNRFLYLDGDINTIPGGGVNFGFIHVDGGVEVANTVIDHCKSTWSGVGDYANDNAGGFYFRRIDGNDGAALTVSNIETHGFRTPVLYKSGDDTITSSTGNFSISNSFFYYSGAGSAHRVNPSGIHYDDCIFASNLAMPEANGFPGGDWNTFNHCTFMNGLTMGGDTQSGDNLPGSQNNKFTNSIINGAFTLSGASSSITSDSDYNAFKANTISNKGVSETLAQWQTSNSSDANSVEGTVTFTGGDAATIGYYALQAGSVGKGAASDAKDMGADTALVGVDV